ncbi:hypothetical protein LguiB_002849 [Lonicera macranthoides]
MNGSRIPTPHPPPPPPPSGAKCMESSRIALEKRLRISITYEQFNGPFSHASLKFQQKRVLAIQVNKKYIFCSIS